MPTVSTSPHSSRMCCLVIHTGQHIEHYWLIPVLHKMETDSDKMPWPSKCDSRWTALQQQQMHACSQSFYRAVYISVNYMGQQKRFHPIIGRVQTQHKKWSYLALLFGRDRFTLYLLSIRATLTNQWNLWFHVCRREQPAHSIGGESQVISSHVTRLMQVTYVIVVLWISALYLTIYSAQWASKS